MGEILDSAFLTCYAIVDFERRRCRVTDRVFSKQFTRDRPNGAKAIRTAGSTADRRRKLPLLIEFEAQIL